jgi:outer membrane protein assembly factor BamB
VGYLLGSSMYAVSGGNLVASAASGSPSRWSFASHNLDTAPVVNNGVVYALSTSGTVYGVSAATGTEVWSGSVGQATNGPVLSGIAAGGGLLVAPAGSTLTAFGD